MKELAWKLLGALLMEKDRDGAVKISLGRVVLIVTFGMSLWRWHAGMELQNTMQTVLMAAMGYVLGSKVIEGAKDWVASKSAGFADNSDAGNEK